MGCLLAPDVPTSLPAAITAAAGISSSPTVVGVVGDASGATLRVMRPDNMSDDAVATYLIQAYADDKATTKVGPFCDHQRWHSGIVSCGTPVYMAGPPG